jgi:hypothetical protein
MMITMRTTVTAEPVVQLWQPRLGMRSTTCRLRYEPGDPYAVTLTARWAEARSTTWTFARSLLADGCAGQAGVCDVRIWRVTSGAKPQVAFALKAPYGTVHLYAPLAEVTAFVDGMHDAVPPGPEHLLGDLDAELAALLGDAEE